MKQNFEILSHTADISIRTYGITYEELFKNALVGMFACVKPYGKHINYDKDGYPKIGKYTEEHQVNVKSENIETLLVDFLSECLYLSDINNEAYFDAKFKILNPTELEATIFGVPVEGYEETELKAVTYHDLIIEKVNNIYQATLVFDI